MGSPEPVVHIGYHKTGTGWFQRQFYPAVLNARYIPRAVVRQAFLEPMALHFEPDASRRLLGLDRAGPNYAILLCEEELSGNIHSGGLRGCLTKDVAYRLNRTLPNARIVIFIRSQYTALASSYVQYVKEGGTHPASHYFFPERRYGGAHHTLREGPHFSFAHFDYYALIRHYEEVFGEGRVHVFPFEEFLKRGKGFVQELAEALGLEVDLRELPMEVVNPSYPALLLPLARGLNRFSWRDVPDKHYFLSIPGFRRLRVLLLRRLSRLSRMLNLAGFELSSEVKAIAARYYAESNYKLDRERNLGLAAHGYPLGEGEKHKGAKG